MTCGMNWMISWLYFPSSESVISAVVKRRKVRLCTPYHVLENVRLSYMFVIIMVSLEYHVLNHIDRFWMILMVSRVSPLIVIGRNFRGVHAGESSEYSQYWWDVHERDLQGKYILSVCCGYDERVEDANGMDEGSWMRRARQNGRKHIMHISTRNTSARWIRTRQLLLTYTYGILAWMSSIERC